MKQLKTKIRKADQVRLDRWSMVKNVSAEISGHSAPLQVIGDHVCSESRNVVIEPRPPRVRLVASFKNGFSAILEEEKVTLLSPTGP